MQKYDHEFPDKYLSDFLEYLDLDEKNFGKLLINLGHQKFG